MKKILLIGGEGYIGNVIANYFLKEKFNVISYDNLLYNNRICVDQKLHYSNYKFINGDLNNKLLLDNTIQGVDFIILLAGLVGDPITKKYPEESSLINDQGIIKVINMCADLNIERFVFISTCSNYGLIKSENMANENYKLNPLSLYAKSKVNAENYILSLKGQTKMHPTILRFSTAFGLSPRMRFDLTINEFTRELVLGNELSVYDAHTWRPYCHVNDFAKLIHLVLDAPSNKVSFEVFNSGDERNNATKKTIIELIRKKVSSGKIIFSDKGDDARNYRVDFSKVKSILDFKSEFSITDGITEVIQAINNNKFINIESNKNFYGNYEINYK